MTSQLTDQTITFDGRAFINGERVHARDGQTFDCLSPVDGRLLTPVARGSAADIDAAVAAGRAAFEDRRWCGMAPAQRKRVMIKFADQLLAHADELALTETLDMGKPVKYAKGVDVNSAANCIRWYGEAVDKVYDEIAPTPSNSLALITREPVGVVGIIVPWNYPMIMAAWKIAPALAAGNSVVLKPSEKSPLTALRLAELALAAGIPPGVFNVVPGFGTEAGSPLALHMDVDCIAFTGSTRVGKQIHVMAGQSNLKRAWTELGGKSPNIVFADCPDLDKAVEAAVGSIFFNQGESCNAPSRLFVEASIKEAFLEKALKLVPQYQPGNPLEKATVMGAIVDKVQMDNVLRYIGLGKSEGAKLLAGGEAAMPVAGGRRALLGTNPMAAAFPRRQAAPALARFAVDPGQYEAWRSHRQQAARAQTLPSQLAFVQIEGVPSERVARLREMAREQALRPSGRAHPPTSGPWSARPPTSGPPPPRRRRPASAHSRCRSGRSWSAGSRRVRRSD